MSLEKQLLNLIQEVGEDKIFNILSNPYGFYITKKVDNMRYGQTILYLLGESLQGVYDLIYYTEDNVLELLGDLL